MQKGIRGRKVFSQNDEDGAIEDVFKHIGTTNKVLFNVVVWKILIKDMINTNWAIGARCTLNLVWKTVYNATADTSGWLKCLNKSHSYLYIEKMSLLSSLFISEQEQLKIYLYCYRIEELLFNKESLLNLFLATLVAQYFTLY